MATSTDKTAAAATAAAANPLVEVDTKKSVDPAPPNSAKLDPANVSAPSDEESAADASQKDGKGSKTTVATVGTVSGDTSAEVTDVQKKMRRAERFGMPVQLSEQEKRNSRAERFGTAPMSDGSEASKKSEELKRKARAERFGLPVPSEPADEEAKKKARRARFATSSKPDSQEEEKRKARAIRFSNSPASSLSQVNGKGNIESKAAIAGKAGGGL